MQLQMEYLMSLMPPVSLEELKKYPTMTSWFRPGLLAKLLWRVIVSEVFGQYADRRLIVAALDPVKEGDLLQRARQFVPETPFANEDERPPTLFTKDEGGAVWIDFVADLGDGFRRDIRNRVTSGSGKAHAQWPDVTSRSALSN